MENLNPKKSLIDIIKGTITGVDGEGSSKRMATMYVLMFLVTPMTAAFIWAFLEAVHMPDGSKIAMFILGMYITILGILFIYVGINSGLTSVEQLSNLWKTIKGQKTDDQK